MTKVAKELKNDLLEKVSESVKSALKTVVIQFTTCSGNPSNMVSGASSALLEFTIPNWRISPFAWAIKVFAGWLF